MAELDFQRINQKFPTPLVTIKGEKISYRYAYDRSADSIHTDQPGQDYIVVVSDADYLAFVLCDGVSQSFYGDVGAKILGEKLVNWLWENGKELGEERSQLIDKVSLFLNHLTEEASAQIEKMDLPQDLSSMLRVVLEKKRKMGSESTFTSGFIDSKNNKVLLCWMGDSRLRIWDRYSEKTDDLLGAETFQTRERWSSSKGLIGELHGGIFSTNDITRLVTYSDGLSCFDHLFFYGSPSDHTLIENIEESKFLSTSDDISFLEIWIDNHAVSKPILPRTPKKVTIKNISEQKKLEISWTPIKNANRYEIALRSSSGWQIISSDQPHLKIRYDEINGLAGKCTVRSWKNEEVSNWSREIEYWIPLNNRKESESEAIESYVELSERVPVENSERRKKNIISMFIRRQDFIFTGGKIAITLLLIIAIVLILFIQHASYQTITPTLAIFNTTHLILTPSIVKINETEMILRETVLDSATVRSPTEIKNKKLETPSPPFYNHYINRENKFNNLIPK